MYDTTRPFSLDWKYCSDTTNPATAIAENADKRPADPMLTTDCRVGSAGSVMTTAGTAGKDRSSLGVVGRQLKARETCNSLSNALKRLGNPFQTVLL